MKTRKIGKRFSALVIAILLCTIGLALVLNRANFYRERLRMTRWNLAFTRRSIRLFAEKNGRFPDSLRELNEYGKEFRDEIQLYFVPSEFIAGKSNRSEHSILNGTGGLYYDPKTGELKLNLTKPLKSYWKFYFGDEKDHIPADW